MKHDHLDHLDHPPAQYPFFSRLGCGSALLLALSLLLAVRLGGGSIFNPGPLSAAESGETLGGVPNHAALNQRCDACHLPWQGIGAAGLSAAEIVRKRDPSGRVTVVTREPHLFYSRPGIAYYLMGQVPAGQLISRDAAFYQEHRLDLRHDTVERLEPRWHVAYLEAGGPLTYDVALLATGAVAVPPPFPGGDLHSVVAFDSLDDATHIIRLARRARAAVVVGGGITAMELAEGLHARGLHVHFLQRRERLWSSLFTPEESASNLQSPTPKLAKTPHSDYHLLNLFPIADRPLCRHSLPVRQTWPSCRVP